MNEGDQIDQTDELTAQLSCEFLVNVPHGDTVILVVEDRLVDCGFFPVVQVVPVADHGLKGAETVLPPAKPQGGGHGFEREGRHRQVNGRLDDLLEVHTGGD